MSRTISPSSKKPYGVARVVGLWNLEEIRMKWIKASQAVGILSVLVSAFPAYGERACVNEMLEGQYSFRISGQILSGPLAGLDNGIAPVTFDGDGNLTAKDHVVLNVVQPANEWRQSTGAYSLNRDCTGK